MQSISRRSFLKSTTAATSGLLLIPGCISNPPNNRLNIAVIGVGGRGKANWSKVPRENIVAMCDVDEMRAAAGYNMFPKVKKFKDFRVMFDKMANEIDAVIISTPDHTHFAATMIAIELGKHVYVEKPLAHNIWQLRTLKKAAKYYNIVSQMGNQGHTTDGIRLIKEWYEQGHLGQVKEVHAWHGKIRFAPGKYFTMPDAFPPPINPVPDHLDWNLWQGPVKSKPFNTTYVPKSWRGYYDYGNGLLGDWSCHTLDGPFWALNLGMPHTVTAKVTNPRIEHNFVADQSIVTMEFSARGSKAPVTLKWYEGPLPEMMPNNNPDWKIKNFDRSGMMMIGDKNTLVTGSRPNFGPKLAIENEAWEAFKKSPPEKTIPRTHEENPVKEWTDAIKENTLPGSNFDYSADLTEMALVGVLAQRFNTKINYDAKNMKVIDRPDLDIYIKEPTREGWSFGENL